jgi:glycosyltransferase involved in cell wall biosynthesis
MGLKVPPQHRIAVLYSELAGYTAACLNALKNKISTDIFICAWPAANDAPFSETEFASFGPIINRAATPNKRLLCALLEYSPTVVLVAGWIDRGYLKICRELRKRQIPVIAGIDTQWRGDIRQCIACVAAPAILHKSIDVLWVAGERQATFARNLGYQGNRLWDGFYSCDWSRFSKQSEDGDGPHISQARGKTFLYVGRYSKSKGIHTLASAYEAYRKRTDSPWPLITAGTGDLARVLLAANAEDRGFTQPKDLPSLMRQSGTLVLASDYEPWGVVIQEAAAAGLPIICSDACGASVTLVRDSFNGYVFPAGDKSALAERMTKISALEEPLLAQFGRNSFNLSKQYTPERWAQTLLDGVDRFNISRQSDKPRQP